LANYKIASSELEIDLRTGLYIFITPWQAIASSQSSIRQPPPTEGTPEGTEMVDNFKVFYFLLFFKSYHPLT
jgi:hypothetical protein